MDEEVAGAEIAVALKPIGSAVEQVCAVEHDRGKDGERTGVDIGPVATEVVRLCTEMETVVGIMEGVDPLVERIGNKYDGGGEVDAVFSELLAVFFLVRINSLQSLCTIGYFCTNSEANPSVANTLELSRMGLYLCVRIRTSILAEWCKIRAYRKRMS